MTITNQWVGRATPSGARVVAKITGSSATLDVSTNEDMSTGVVTFGPVFAASNIVTLDAEGLGSDTRYYYEVVDESDSARGSTGTFRTHPPLGSQASFTLGVSSCAGATGPLDVQGAPLDPLNVSNHPVFNTIRTKALAENHLAFVHVGDWHYYNIGVDNPADTTTYRRAYDDVLLQPRQQALYESVPFIYTWDDHDYGPNNSDSTAPGRVIANTVYRERVPAYDMAEELGIYQAWQIGRVQFVMTDTRTHRTPNSAVDNSSKTMLGSVQKAWFKTILQNSDSEALVWLCSTPWIQGAGDDTWSGFTTEANELVAAFTSNGWIDRMCVVSGDAHYLALDTGTGVSFGGIPQALFGSLDSGTGGSSLPWDTGSVSGGKNRWGTVRVADLGTRMDISLTGWIGDNQWREHTFSITGLEGALPPAPVTPLPLASPEFVDAVTGSHQMVVAAQVLKEWADGAEPIGGIPINVHGGDVKFDASANVRATCSLITDPENFDVEGLLEPYGNEIFLQRGVLVGPGKVELHPLGYYRITEVTQDNAPFGDVRIEGQDRMSGIIEARLTKPRQFRGTDQIKNVFASLVNEIYPSAQIVFDDATGSDTMGRRVIAERDRFDFLNDLAKARGKLMFWDRLGRLRIMSPPSLENPKWDISYGTKGVLVSLGRKRSRGDTYNAVVAMGEAGDTNTPVRAIAVDNDPLSPTYWYGRYGKVPRFYVSPFITNGGHAKSAARNILAAQLGVASNVSFNVVPNPALDLNDAVRVTHDPRLGTTTHVLDTLVIPLGPKEPVSGSTRIFSDFDNIELS